LLAGVTESLKAGILLIAPDGTIVHANRYAQTLCQQARSPLSTPAARSLTLPAPIHTLVHALVESQELFPGYDLILEDEITTAEGSTVEISARWLKAEPGTPPHILVTLAIAYHPYQNWPRSQQQTGTPR